MTEKAEKKTSISRLELTLDIGAFIGTVVFAVILKWQAKDVIWGLWTCSLTTGYASIVTAIVAPACHSEGIGRLLMLGGGVFLLAFFTIHFGMFHFVHGVFLNVFFPIVPEKHGFPNILELLLTALPRYWPLVAMTLVSRWSDLPFSNTTISGKDPFIKPYANVIRMHLLIFVFAGLHVAGMSQYAIFPVLAFYFVPWGTLIRYWRRDNEDTNENKESSE